MVACSRRTALSALVVAWSVSLAPPAAAGDAAAPSDPGELEAARALFSEALRDQEAGRYEDALKKFERVRAVRDTASVEFRIGSCEEGLTRPVPAYEAYLAATRLGAKDPAAAEVTEAAQARLGEVTKRVARLRLGLPADAPADAEIRVDGSPVTRAALAEPLVLDPGPHVVIASTAGSSPVRSDVVLPEGAQLFLAIPLVSARASAPAAAVPEPPAPAERSSGATPVVAIAALAGGGVLLAAGGILWAVRAGDIAKINRECPSGHCPATANPSDIEATRSRALAEGPAAIALAAAGVVAAGVGAVLLWTAPEHPPASAAKRAQTGASGVTAWPVPVVAWGGGGLAVAGSFP
jgi:hypothetical protein